MRYVWMEKVDLKRTMSKRNGYKRTPIPQTNYKMRCRIRFVLENVIALYTLRFCPVALHALYNFPITPH